MAPGGRAPDVLVDISNDGWFNGSAEHDMHLAIAKFRSVEHRTPGIRAVNRGISAIIDGNGRVTDELPKLSAGAIVAEVPLDPRSSLYSRVRGRLRPRLLRGDRRIDDARRDRLPTPTEGPDRPIRIDPIEPPLGRSLVGSSMTDLGRTPILGMAPRTERNLDNLEVGNFPTPKLAKLPIVKL